MAGLREYKPESHRDTFALGKGRSFARSSALRLTSLEGAVNYCYWVALFRTSLMPDTKLESVACRLAVPLTALIIWFVFAPLGVTVRHSSRLHDRGTPTQRCRQPSTAWYSGDNSLSEIDGAHPFHSAGSLKVQRESFARASRSVCTRIAADDLWIAACLHRNAMMPRNFTRIASPVPAARS